MYLALVGVTLISSHVLISLQHLLGQGKIILCSQCNCVQLFAVRKSFLKVYSDKWNKFFLSFGRCFIGRSTIIVNSGKIVLVL